MNTKIMTKEIFCLIVISCHIIIAVGKTNFHDQVNELVTNGLTSITTRQYEIYSKATGKRVQIRGKKTNANGAVGSEYAKMEISSTSFWGVITIRGVASGRYLCMNKRGKLIAKRRGRGKRCRFLEKMGEDYFDTFTNLRHPSWFVSFQKNGRPRKGPKTKNGRDDVKFLTFLIPTSPNPTSPSMLDEETWHDLEKEIMMHFLSKSHPMLIKQSDPRKYRSTIRRNSESQPTIPPEIEKKIEKRRKFLITISKKRKKQSLKKRKKKKNKKKKNKFLSAPTLASFTTVQTSPLTTTVQTTPRTTSLSPNRIKKGKRKNNKRKQRNRRKRLNKKKS